MDQQERKQRINQIIDAAEPIIFEKGIEKAAMSAIARKAGLSKGTLYLYFENKDELYVGIAQRGMQHINTRLADVLAGNFSGIQLVQQMTETYLHFVDENPGYFQSFAHYESVINSKKLGNSTIIADCEECVARSIQLMTRALQVGIQDGTLKESINPKEIAVLLLASARGITSMQNINYLNPELSLLNNVSASPTRLFRSFLTLVAEGLVTEQGRQEMTNGHHAKP